MRATEAARLKTLLTFGHFAGGLVWLHPIRSLHVHLKPRWAAACGAWFAALLAVASGLSDWRVAVMVSATAFMLARAGDMLDDH